MMIAKELQPVQHIYLITNLIHNTYYNRLEFKNLEANAIFFDLDKDSFRDKKLCSFILGHPKQNSFWILSAIVLIKITKRSFMT